MSGAPSALLGSGGAPGVLAAALPDASGVGSASIQLKNDGTFAITGQSGANWVAPANASVAALYQVKSQVTSGALNTDPSAGSYIDLSASRTWSKLAPGTAVLTFTIREKATGFVRATFTGVQVIVA